MRDDSFRDFVMEQLQGIKPVDCRAMFGGYGIYRGRDFFGIIHKGRLYFKVSEDTKPAFTNAGMGSFKPNRRQNLKSFYEVPVDVLESQPQIVDWANAAIESASQNHS